MSASRPEPERDDRAVEELLEQHTAELRAFVRLRSGPMLRSNDSP